MGKRSDEVEERKNGRKTARGWPFGCSLVAGTTAAHASKHTDEERSRGCPCQELTPAEQQALSERARWFQKGVAQGLFASRYIMRRSIFLNCHCNL